MSHRSVAEIFRLGEPSRVCDAWVQKACAAPVGSQRGKLLLIVLAILADESGRIRAQPSAIATTAELSLMEFCLFVQVLKNKGFLRWDGCWVLDF